MGEKLFSNTASSSGASLTMEDLEKFFNEAESATPRRLQLIAPNLKVAKQWAKEYPGYDILISSKNLPTTSKKGDVR
jgi:hypothetical protein